ncbi:MAG: YceI family protein [Vicinamibacterales bacterium]
MATTYAIEKAHSEVFFQVRHLVTKVRGRFSDFDGSVVMDEDNPGLSSVKFNIKAASVDTNVTDRDNHLRSGDFFAADEHPELTFVSKKITKKGADSFDVLGDLTIRGTTKEVSLPVSFLGKAKDPWGQNKVGFEAETTLNRKDFGLNWNAALETGGLLVGDEVKVNLSIQAIAQ